MIVAYEIFFVAGQVSLYASVSFRLRHLSHLRVCIRSDRTARTYGTCTAFRETTIVTRLRARNVVAHFCKLVQARIDDDDC